MPSVLLTLALTLPASLPQSEFRETRRMVPRQGDPGAYQDGPAVQAYAAGDVDGNGYVDLFLARAEDFTGKPERNALLLNQSAGLFLDAGDRLPDTELDSRVALLADFDGDGDLDLFVGNRPNAASGAPGTDELLRNDGTGTFTTAVGAFGLNLPTWDAGAGDVDLDGDIDLIQAYLPSDSLRLLRNAGVGFDLTFDPAAFPAQASSYAELELGDLDADGDADVLHGWIQGYSTYANDGGGIFGAIDLQTTPAQSVDLGDVDGDGDLDAYLTHFTGDSLLLNTGSGVMAPSPAALPAVALAGVSREARFVDLDGDNASEVLAAGGLAPYDLFVLDNDGAGLLTDETAALAPLIHRVDEIAVFDADGDDDPDVMTFAYLAEPHLWLNDGVSFREAHAQPNGFSGGGSPTSAPACVLGDVNGDGALDILSNAALDPLIGPGSPPQPLIQLQINSGAGVFTEVAGDYVPDNPPLTFAVHLADVDGDGDHDVSIGTGVRDVLLLNVDGAGTLAPLADAYPLKFEPTIAIAGGDLDGDGDYDQISKREPSPFLPTIVDLLLGDGTGRFTEAPGAVTLIGSGEPAGAGDIDVLDVDGDGDLDLLVPTNLGAELHANDGTGAFTWVKTIGPASSCDIGDVDDDGDADLLLATVGTGDPAGVYLADGAGGFPLGQDLGPKSAGGAGHLVDYEGDGDLDVFIGADEVFLGDGAGSFSHAPGLIDVPGSLLGVGDLDGDADADLVLLSTGQLIVATGTQGGQVAWRTLPRVGKPQRVEVFGPPGSPFVLAAATASASLPLGALGTLLLDPSVLVIAEPGGQIPPSGVFTLEVAVPDAPGMLGATVWWQALLGDPARFTNADPTTFTAY